MCRNYYVHPDLDRSGHLRTNQAEIARMLETNVATILPVWRAKSLIQNADKTPELAAIPSDSRKAVLEEGKGIAFLGMMDGRPYFAIDLSHHDQPPLQEYGDFFDLREVGPAMSAAQGALAALARGMVHWHTHHRFCGKCGHPTKNQDAGHRRECVNPQCGKDHFPRTDPAVIMLVQDQEGRALLGRSPHFPEGMYSTLAGFVEPGETLEQAVSCEVFEETGICTRDVSYHSSQPWPFPSSLMLGFDALAKSQEINIDPSEIEDARWFHRDELTKGEALGKYRTPRKDSISWVLISDWLNSA